ncbi:AraC family transcriptional regulator (plasmid) [Aminobacter sp. SR38]|jgi:AraC-like DNA-binding protein|uniref:AraC family transcriptional regulator n=1 Tax=Aminobacter sp. SR38 TaxID=2774562 RepID=UPI0017826FF0|nr:AraC family transcriptional regulator [Aminobacter sp. SR38]QOF75510.1 AraC family transcriptional regulator [Aminobacter sp. SR38]
MQLRSEIDSAHDESQGAGYQLRMEVAPGEATRYRRNWQDALREAYFPLDVRSVGDSERPAFLYAQDLPNLRVGGVSCGAMSIRHLREHASTGGAGDFFHIPMPVMNPIKLIQRGREALVRPGDLAMISTADQYIYEQPAPNRLRTLTISGKMLREYYASADDLTAVTFSADIPEVRLFMSYAQTLSEVVAKLSQKTASGAVNVLFDMLKVAMLAGQGNSLGTSSVRTAHAQRALRIIEDRYRDPTFGVGPLAQEFGCTSRYLQQIFQERKQCVSEVIRARRLAAAKRMLQDSLLNCLSISQVAYRSGFSNPNHFSKTFFDHFGLRPADVRSLSRGVSALNSADDTPSSH